MTTSPITKKQQEIIRLIYQYRFINRTQLQTLMQLKDERRLGVWLKNLCEQHYIQWIYSTDFTERTKPAIYYLDTYGVRFKKGLAEYPKLGLHKRYKESIQKLGFITKSPLLVDCVLDIATQTTNELTYTVTTQADYAAPGHKNHSLGELSPDLRHERIEQTKLDAVTEVYLIAILEATHPRYVIRKLLMDYVIYLYAHR